MSLVKGLDIQHTMQLDSGGIRGAVEIIYLFICMGCLFVFWAKWGDILTCVQCYVLANLRHLPLVTPNSSSECRSWRFRHTATMQLDS